jgi:hypothetical protein
MDFFIVPTRAGVSPQVSKNTAICLPVMPGSLPRHHATRSTVRPAVEDELHHSLARQQPAARMEIIEPVLHGEVHVRELTKHEYEHEQYQHRRERALEAQWCGVHSGRM